MPLYDLTDSDNGDTLTVEANRPPSQSETNNIFSEHRKSLAAEPMPPWLEKPKPAPSLTPVSDTTVPIDFSKPSDTSAGRIESRLEGTAGPELSEQKQIAPQTLNELKSGVGAPIDRPKLEGAPRAGLGDILIHENPELIKRLGTSEDTAAKTELGVAESLRNNLNALSSDESLALIAASAGISAIGPVAARAVAASWAEVTANQVPELAGELGSEMGKPKELRDPTKIARLIGDITVATGIAVGAGAHALKPSLTPLTDAATKGTDAIQERGPAKVPVEVPPGRGEAVVKGTPGTETSALPQAQKETLTPAIQTPEGKVVAAEPDHVAAYEKAKATGTPDTSGSQEGFQKPTGEFLDREQAAKEADVPTQVEPGKLHSSDRTEAHKPGTGTIGSGIAKAKAKWTRATDVDLGSEAGFFTLQPLKDLYDKAEPWVRAVAAHVVKIGEEQMKLGKMPDFRRSVLQWSGKLQKSFSEADSAKTEIKTRVKDENQRIGITNWLEAGGDRQVLIQRAASTTDPTLRAGYDAALNLTPESLAVAQDVRDTFDTMYGRGNAHGVINSFKDNYVTHMWQSKPESMGMGGTVLRDRFRFAKARTFNSFYEGEQLGYKPKTKDIANILPVYIHEMNSVIAARQLIADLRNGVASDGRPLLAPKGVGSTVSGPQGQATLVMPKAGKEDFRDYKVINNQPALNDWIWVQKDAAGNNVFLKADLAVHPEAYGKLNATLGQSAIKQWYRTPTTASAEIPKVIVRALDKANQEAKRTMLGFFATFHQVQEGTHAGGHRVLPANIPTIDLVANADQADAARHGLMIYPDRASESQWMEGFRTSGLISHIPLIGAASDWYGHYLFHDYIPGLKYKTYQHILERNMKRYAPELGRGEVNPEDVKALSAEQTNAAFGHLNYADLARNPTIQHLAQFFVLAPDFLEARLRFTGQALKGATGAKVGREQVTALGTLAVAQAALAWTAAKVVGGQWDEDKPFEMRHGDRVYTLRSVPEDNQRLLQDARVFAYNRLSPMGRFATEFATGVDVFGRKISKGEAVKHLATSPIPLFLKSWMGLNESGISPAEQGASSLGLRISKYTDPKIIEAGKLNQYADDLYRKARKLPKSEREHFVNESLMNEDYDYHQRDKVKAKLKRQGLYKYE